MQTLGSKGLASQSNITAAQARQAGRIKTTDVFKNVNQRTGLSNMDDMTEVARTVTGRGENSVLDSATREAVSSTSGVKLGSLRDSADKLIQSKGGLLSKSEKQNLLDQVQSVGTSMRGGAAGSLSDLADPNAALDAANSFRGSANTINRSLTASPEQKQLAGIYNSLADEIEDAIYSSSGVAESLPGIVKRSSATFKELASEAIQNGNEKLGQAYSKLADDVAKVKTVKGLRSFKKDFVDLGKIDEWTAINDSTRTISGKDVSASVKNILGNTLNAATVPVSGKLANAGNTLTQLSSKVAPTAGQSLTGATTRQALGRGVVSTLNPGSSSNQTALTDALTASQTADTGNMIVGTGSLSNGEVYNIGTDTGTGTSYSSTTNPLGYSSTELAQAYMQALASGDETSAEQLASMYELAAEYEAAQAEATTTELSDNEQKIQSALSTIDSLEQQFDQAGGGQGIVAGSLANLGANVGLNSSLAAYNDVSKGSVSQIIKALGDTGALSDGDTQRALTMLPKSTDTAETARQKWELIREIISKATPSTSTTYATENQLSGY